MAQATGVLIATGRLAPTEAWNLLRTVSQHTNVKLRQIALWLIQWGHTGTWPAPLGTELRRQLRAHRARYAFRRVNGKGLRTGSGWGGTSRLLLLFRLHAAADAAASGDTQSMARRGCLRGQNGKAPAGGMDRAPGRTQAADRGGVSSQRLPRFGRLGSGEAPRALPIRETVMKCPARQAHTAVPVLRLPHPGPTTMPAVVV
ncbi:ANTAR domain-containing protein [Streptomyces sp. NPDC102406]|uniref:ANTAR domain-containing protein n=1 Tax=Streptomyces sp. NPDC102406 TaxID=3366171 RepID=UPI00381AC89F